MAVDVFSPLRIGAIEIPNRVVMAPMTRCRALPDGSPHALNALYYEQRANPKTGAGLIITEATQVSQQGIGYPGTPGIYTDAHVAGWRLVTDAVHRVGGRIFLQLWHVGRVSHSLLQPGRGLPVSSSAVARTGETQTLEGSKPFETPRALNLEEIPGVIEQFKQGAVRAKRAGFDGVELHGANGYLPDQFLRDGVNQRTDRYGGSIENRARFLVGATRAICEVWGADRVGVRLSPSGTFNEMKDSNARATFSHAVRALDALGVAYLHIMEAVESDVRHGMANIPGYEAIPVSFFRPMVKGTLITNGGFTKEKADEYLARGDADAVAFGIPFIANPDLTERFRRGAGLTPPDPATFYTGRENGYTDFPALPA